MNIFKFLLLISQIYATVIGIDYGTDWLKVSVIKPGGQIETVLNRESKRKTNAVLNIRKGIRSFGIEAQNLGMRFPTQTYSSLKSLLGKQFVHDHTKEYQSLFSNNIFQCSPRDTVCFKHDDALTFEVEELVANLFSHCRQQAENYAAITVSGAVITVPFHFTQFERRAILDAAEIAGLKVYALINDQTAEYHMFYDMGAGTTAATLVSFHSGSDPKLGIKNLVDLEVVGFDVDLALGGNVIDRRLQQHLAQEFDKKYPKSKLNDRAMERLLKEANRCKTILSANDKVFAGVEGLVDGIDFKLEISRKTLESLSDDLFSRVTTPIKNVLKDTNVNLDQIQSLVLFGGSVRVPGVQRVLEEYVGRDKIARNVDGDEAAVFGAVLHAAAISSQFRLGQTMRIKDINPVPINVWYDSTKTNKKINTNLFTKKSVLGTKKLMTFKKVEDFEFGISYDYGNEIVDIASVKIGGLKDAVAKYNDTAIEDPKVKVQISLNESGLLEVSLAKASFEIDKGKASITESVLNYFKGKEGEEEPTVDAEVPEDKEAEKAEVKKEKEEKEKKTSGKKIIVENVDLTIDIEYKTVSPLSKESKLAMAKKLAQMNQEDVNRFLREESLNKLEAFIYKCKELSWDDSVEKYSTPAELESLKNEASIQSEWLEDKSETASVEEFKEHKLKLSVIADPIIKRISEHQQRPTYVTKFNKEILEVQKISQSVKDNINNTNISEKEVNELDEFIEKKIQWLVEKEALQAKLELFQDAVLTIDDIKFEIRDMRKFVKVYDLKKRKKIVSPFKNEKKDKSNDEKFDEYGGMSKEEFENFLKATKMSKEDLLKMMKNYKKPEDNVKPEGDSNTEGKSNESEGDINTEGKADELEKEFEELDKEVKDDTKGIKGHEEL